MKRRIWFLGAVGAVVMASASCELLVTFPASQIDGGESDAATPDVSTAMESGPNTDAKHDDASDAKSVKDAQDAPSDVPGDTTTPTDSPTDVAPDTPDVKSADAPTDGSAG